MKYVLGMDLGSRGLHAATLELEGPPGTSFDDEEEPIAVGVDRDGRRCLAEPAQRLAGRAGDRAVRDLVERIGDDTPIVLGDLRIAPESALADLIALELDRARERTGEAPVAVAIAHPAAWGPYRAGVLESALRHRIDEPVTLVPAVEAAALGAAPEDELPVDAVVVVCDLGASSLDLAAIRVLGDGRVAPAGPARSIPDVGGEQLDDALLQHVRDHLPADLPPARLAELRRRCAAAKEALSSATTTELRLDATRHIRLVRADLETAFATILDRAVAAVRAVLDEARERGPVHGVLLAGGAARLPLLAERLSDELEVAVLPEDDPMTATSRGAALLAAQRVRADTDEAAPEVPVPAVVPSIGTAAVPAWASEPAPDAAAREPVPLLRPGTRRRVVAGAAALAAAAAVLVAAASVPTPDTAMRGNAGAAAERATGAPVDGTAQAPAASGGGEDAAPPSGGRDPDPAPKPTPRSRADTPSPKEGVTQKDTTPTETESGTGTPAPQPDPTTDPAPDPTPDPTPDPAPDPTTPPDPTPTPDPTTPPPPDPQPTTPPDPAPQPEPEPTTPPPPAPDPSPDPGGGGGDGTATG